MARQWAVKTELYAWKLLFFYQIFITEFLIVEQSFDENHMHFYDFVDLTDKARTRHIVCARATRSVVL